MTQIRAPSSTSSPSLTATFSTVPWIGETSVSVAPAAGATAGGALAARRPAQPRAGARLPLAPRGADHLDAVQAAVDLDLVACAPRSSGSAASIGPGIRGRLGRRLERLQPLAVTDQVAAGLGVAPLLGGQDRLVERDQGHQAADLVLAEGPQHPRRRPLAIGVPDDQLGDHRVIQRGHLRAGANARVDPHARARGLAVGGDRARRRGEVLVRGLGVDPALDRVPAKLHVVLAHRELLAGGDQDLLADDVDAGDHLGDAVLDLHAGVHLEEEVVVAVLQPLDRPRRAVVDRARRRRSRSCRSAPASPRRRAARAPPRSASGGGAGSSSRARRGGSRCRASRRAPGPRRGEGPPGSARGRRWGRRRTSRPRARPPRTPPRARPRSARPESPCRRPRRPPCRRPGSRSPSPAFLALRDALDRRGRAGDDRDAGLRHQLAGARLRAHRLDRARRRADERRRPASSQAAANSAFSARKP